MNFEEFWANAAEIGYPTDERSKNLAMSAWDAALCAASAQAFERGKLRTNHQIAATLSDLHTWVKPKEDQS
jgi:hypothetical protein